MPLPWQIYSKTENCFPENSFERNDFSIRQFSHKQFQHETLGFHFGDFEIIADSDSKPSKTSRKVISDTKNFSSFHFIRDYGSKITWPFFEVKNQNLYYR